jgi:hypothetical protein
MQHAAQADIEGIAGGKLSIVPFVGLQFSDQLIRCKHGF